MIFTTKLFLILLVGLCLSCGLSYAQEIKYSLGPFCNEGKVVCVNPNETPTCLVFDPKIHVSDRFQPSCENSSGNFLPGCIDVAQEDKPVVMGVTLECFEYVQCVKDENSNKFTASCSDGKEAKCLGSDGVPNCGSETVCDNGSIPVCDYVKWANVDGASYQ